MAWKKIHNKYPAGCSRCRGKLDRGAVVWYDRHADRGAKIRCLACGAGVDVPVQPAPVPAPAEVEVELVRVPTPSPAPAPVVTEVRPDDAGLAAAIAAAIGPLVNGAVDEAAVRSIEDGDGDWKSAVAIGGRDRIEIILGAEGERSYSLDVPGLTQAMAIILVAACVRDIVVLLPVNGAPEMPGEAAFLKQYGFVQCRS